MTVPFHEVKHQVIDLLKYTKYSSADIARMTGASARTIMEYAKKLRDPMDIKRYGQLDKERRFSYQEVYDMRITQGLTHKQMGEIMGSSKQAAFKLCNKYGIKKQKE